MILGVPFGRGGLGKTEGTEKAPQAVFDVLKDGINESGTFRHYEKKLLTLPGHDIEESLQKIEEAVKSKQPTCIVGGDHTITYAAFRAFANMHDNTGLLVFDAHPDLMQSFSVPTHDNYLRQLIEEHIITPQHIILVGVRQWDKEEAAFLSKHNILKFTMQEIATEGIHNSCDAIMAAARQVGQLYISVDIDAVDPAFAPGTGYLEPGGLSSRELLYMLTRLRLLKNLSMCDIVEINPAKDSTNRTTALGAKIIETLY
ncbi:hypothetical protein GF342_00710 [Candidatus Woesearchaeota archaeon]|nr:hypothetical protein [Candidatus Woesearchaeota archaeon]